MDLLQHASGYNVHLMTAPTFLLAASIVTAVLALVLSFIADGWARRLAIASLWLALATVPTSIAWDVAYPPEGAGAIGKSSELGAALSHLTSYGVAIMPAAGVAMIALRRAKIANSKRAARG
jgi:hypothetical protein